jgi:hypothetical protein
VKHHPKYPIERSDNEYGPRQWRDLVIVVYAILAGLCLFAIFCTSSGAWV